MAQLAVHTFVTNLDLAAAEADRHHQPGAGQDDTGHQPGYRDANKTPKWPTTVGGPDTHVTTLDGSCTASR